MDHAHLAILHSVNALYFIASAILVRTFWSWRKSSDIYEGLLVCFVALLFGGVFLFLADAGMFPSYLSSYPLRPLIYRCVVTAGMWIFVYYLYFRRGV